MDIQQPQTQDQFVDQLFMPTVCLLGLIVGLVLQWMVFGWLVERARSYAFVLLAAARDRFGPTRLSDRALREAQR